MKAGIIIAVNTKDIYFLNTWANRGKANSQFVWIINFIKNA